MIQKHVYSHCIKNSTFRNQQLMIRATKKFGHEIYACRLHMTQTMVWKCYDNVYKISKRTFDKIVELFDQFKDGEKRTDLCGICVKKNVITY